MPSNKQLNDKLKQEFSDYKIIDNYSELTLIVDVENIKNVCKKLKNDFNFLSLIDICGVDYLHFGYSEWQQNASNTGFSRAKMENNYQQKKIDLPLPIIFYQL